VSTQPAILNDPGSAAEPVNRAAMVLRVSGISSPAAARGIEASLSKMAGVSARASHSSQSIRLEFDRRACALAEVAHRLDKQGVRIVGAQAIDPQSRQDAQMLAPTEPRVTNANRLRAKIDEYWGIILASVGALLLLAVFLVHAFDGPQWLRLSLLAGCYVIAGWHTAIDTLRTLRQFRFDIDVLMFAAAIGAAILGHYEEGGLLLVLFAFGGAGEELALGKARSAIGALAQLAPETAIVRSRSGEQHEVRVESLNPGDEVIVRPFDRLPADGEVIEGSSAVDQSPITGESVPVEKQPGDKVFAGTINGQGMVVVRVSKLSSESTVAKIVRLVNEAQTTKSPTQQFTDRIERAYVPLVLITTATLILLPPLMGLTHRQADSGLWAGWFYQAMAFLTAASPCALAIGTPAAVLSGIARAARMGVLIKGGAHLENLGRINAIAFDKTGTITQGKPMLTDVLTMNAQDESELLRIAAAVESVSSHPLAGAIVAAAQNEQLTFPPVTQAEQIPASGVRAVVEGRIVTVGKASLLPHDVEGVDRLNEALARLNAEGKTTVVIGIDGTIAGVIALADLPRTNARAAIDRLRAAGIRHTIMLTGDNSPAAGAIAKQVGIDAFHAQLLPEDKVTLVRELSEKYGGVAMIGDGVNDAPAMAAATVGIAMGGAGTDVALETADIALMADDLNKLPDAIGLSRFSRKIITQNLAIALGVIGVLAPLSALGFTYLGIAVLFHEGSTVIVVLNSLRLLFYRPR